ncbi:hypothetical protein FH609_017180 [Streptomyces sp. 3MP-14]|uniref:Uncharacterized protein n=1 Tax=Streptomyces mimosae TaxID=2586635 RepID=A0A5N6ABH6_9ACTN|nr:MULTISPECIES: hypothetical protein [Streptomyces]KAB8165296.1 hypothetical protein FH607_014505 [Streptomyces mimosae]KAB8175928.1 hypothetical protein FH609_017180 [Streptomyces sp. 3MP-14]
MPDLLPRDDVTTWGPRQVPVPYATHWTGEDVTASRIVLRPDFAGIRYPDETPTDRDAHGVLWGRVRQDPGAGKPDFQALHPNRQRRTMEHRLCQVCAQPASHNRDGWLFLLNADHDHNGDTDTDTDRAGFEGALVTKPPLCLPCAQLATHHCPHLTRPTAIRSRRPRVWGVFGTLYTLTPAARLQPHHDLHLPYTHPALPWFLASQLVTELKRCTTVDLTTEFQALR